MMYDKVNLVTELYHLFGSELLKAVESDKLLSLLEALVQIERFLTDMQPQPVIDRDKLLVNVVWTAGSHCCSYRPLDKFDELESQFYANLESQLTRPISRQLHSRLLAISSMGQRCSDELHDNLISLIQSQN